MHLPLWAETIFIQVVWSTTDNMKEDVELWRAENILLWHFEHFLNRDFITPMSAMELQLCTKFFAHPGPYNVDPVYTGSLLIGINSPLEVFLLCVHVRRHRNGYKVSDNIRNSLVVPPGNSRKINRPLLYSDLLMLFQQ